MIIFFEAGQLGNQLFQYCALKKFQVKGVIYLIGMKPLKASFLGLEVAGNTRLEFLIERFIRRLGKYRLERLAKKYRLIGLIEENVTTGGRVVELTRGFFSDIYFCNFAFFQAEHMIDDLTASKLELRPELMERVSNIFMTFPKDKTETIFVHVRRGDYVYWPSPTSPAVLPFGWYREQMDFMRKKYVKPFFIITTDDVPYVEEMFGSFRDVFISHENEYVDLALMSQCNGGILSASSFSWWAAYFARRHNKDAFFVAPLYWAGHQRGKWFPEGIKTKWLTYFAVSRRYELMVISKGPGKIILPGGKER